MDFKSNKDARERLVELHKEIHGGFADTVTAGDLDLVVDCLNGLLEQIESNADHKHHIL